MRVKPALVLSLFAAFGLGAATMQVLHAHSKSPAYAILEIDVTNQDAFLKEYASAATKTIEGAPPKGRVIVTAYDNLEQVQAALALQAEWPLV